MLKYKLGWDWGEVCLQNLPKYRLMVTYGWKSSFRQPRCPGGFYECKWLIWHTVAGHRQHTVTTYSMSLTTLKMSPQTCPLWQSRLDLHSFPSRLSLYFLRKFQTMVIVLKKWGNADEGQTKAFVGKFSKMMHFYQGEFGIRITHEVTINCIDV